jgi:hypothetical protein
MISSYDRDDIIGTLTVYAESRKAAMKRIKEDVSMAGLRFYPFEGKMAVKQVEEAAIAA